MEDKLDDFINYDTVFINSPGSCIELSSKIVNLTNLGISIPRRDTQDLFRSRIRLRQILTRMENCWKNLLQEVQSCDDKVIFTRITEPSPNSPTRWRELTSMLGQGR